ncbi:family 78 glycoside hydrolase catalytic domain [Mariniphaga sediminis]|nr:family 78 glycoside hydrolase catalytic domain [Mariniphaga sediminis]
MNTENFPGFDKYIGMLFLSIICMLTACKSPTAPHVHSLKCVARENPLGVEVQDPKLSWKITSGERNVTQKAYHILVADALSALNANQGNIWDSGKTDSDASIRVPYSGKPLNAAKKYYWKVKIWDNKGNESGWSEPAIWQMGMLSPEDWKDAKWVGYEELKESEKIVPAWHHTGKPEWGDGKNILPLLRKEFRAEKQIKQATAFISGLGHFDLFLNGEKVGDHFLDPGWTLYQKHALYVTFDVTKQIKQGDNALGVMLGNGFYYIPRERYRKLTGAYGYPKMICRLVLEYEDGTSQDVVSDASWKAAPGPITFSGIYSGESYDATREQPGWNSPSFDDSAWEKALIVEGPSKLDATIAPPMKIFEKFLSQQITQPKPGYWIYDLGQNASAIPQISVRGEKGQTVKIIPGELLDGEGMVSQASSGGPVYFEYTLKGEATETWRPRFTYYGYRYLQIEGAVPDGEANPDNLPVTVEVQGLHTRNASKKIGEFYCSNELFNRINTLIDWAVKSNMAHVFTDCPHREKLGWLEEAYLMGNSIQYNYDIENLCKKVIEDMKASQTPEGLIPDIAPEYVVFNEGFRDSPEWGSCGVILPWYVYQWYGDKTTLQSSYNMMQHYVNYLDHKSQDHILSYGLGDWVDIGPKPPGHSQNTPFGITATATFYYDICILKEVAHILNKPEDVKKYELLRARVKEAFNNTFFNEEQKYYGTNSQAANAMAVYMDLVEPENREAVIANIIKDIRDRNNSLTAGDIGFRYLIQVLASAGRSDVIYDMNSRTDVPGYGYQLEQGATALTESWQAFPNLSHNHLMLGHLMEWFYNGLGGIRQEKNSVAFKTIVLKPEPAGNMEEVKAFFESPYGPIKSEWRKKDGQFEYDIEVPVNTTALVYLPSAGNNTVTESGRLVEEVDEVSFVKTEENCSVYRIGSGAYSFKVK